MPAWCGAGWRAARVVLLAALAFCAGGGKAVAGPPAAPPARHAYTNVIMISLQCLRPDHLGVYGYQRDTSRNIDGFARGAVVFENAVAEANLTPVAQMSILTSQYPRRHGMVSFEVKRDAVTRRSLQEILQLYGYRTAAVASSPEFFMRFDSETGALINPGDVFSQSFDYFSTARRGFGGKGVRTLPVDALTWLRDNKDKKFFLWIASGLIHMPYASAVPRSFKTMYDPPGYTPFWKRIPGVSGEITAEEDPSYDIFSRVYHNQFFWDFKPVYGLTEDDVKFVNARYDAGVYYTDLFIGELLRLLDSLGLTEKTLIVLHSSHGDDLGERGDFFHYDVSDGVIRDTLIMRFPGGEFAGRRVPQQVGGIDIMPTVLGYLGIVPPHEAQGENLIPLLKDESKGPPHDFVYIDRIPWWEYTLSKWYLEFHGGKGAHFPPSERARLREYLAMLQQKFGELDYPPGDIAVRTRQWKLILRKAPALLSQVSWWGFITGRRHEVEEVELYDLLHDPSEKRNVARDHPDVVAWLKEKLLAWDASMEGRKATFRKEEKRWIIPYP